MGQLFDIDIVVQSSKATGCVTSSSFFLPFCSTLVLLDLGYDTLTIKL